MIKAAAAAHLLAPGQFERISKALADRRRVELLEAIAASAESRQPLCRCLPLAKATISHHLKALVRSGLVVGKREGLYKVYRVRSDVLAAYATALVERLGGSARRDD